MRRLSYFGLILLLIGLACVVFGALGLRNVTKINVGQSDDQVWSYARDLTAGRTYILYIESGDAWGVPFGKGDFDSPMPVNVTITSPSGLVTSLQAFFYGLPTDSPYYQEGTPPTTVEVRYQNVDDSSLSVDTSSVEIRFTVKKAGNYSAEVLHEGLWSDTPPNFFVFYEEFVSNREAYSLLAFGGGAAGAVGGVTFIVARFGKEGFKRKRTRK